LRIPTEKRIGAKLPLAALALAALFAAGCDPVVDIAGADFPAWLICVIAGVALAAALRPVFVAIRIEPHLGPLTVVYSSLAVLLSCVVWMIFFNRI
jgi:YtcA family